jgi:hypothetical protein
MTMDDFESWQAFPPDLRAALGALMIEWSRFENNLVLVFSMFIGNRLDAGWVIYYNMGGFSARKELISRILDHSHKDAAFRPKIESLLKDALPLSTLRNDYAHGFWRHFTNPETKQCQTIVGQFKPRKSSDKSTYRHEPTSDALQKLADQIAALTKRLNPIVTELTIAFPQKQP